MNASGRYGFLGNLKTLEEGWRPLHPVSGVDRTGIWLQNERSSDIVRKTSWNDRAPLMNRGRRLSDEDDTVFTIPRICKLLAAVQSPTERFMIYNAEAAVAELLCQTTDNRSNWATSIVTLADNLLIS